MPYGTHPRLALQAELDGTANTGRQKQQKRSAFDNFDRAISLAGSIISRTLHPPIQTIVSLFLLLSIFGLPLQADTLIATGRSILLVDIETNEISTFITSGGGGMFFEEDSELLYFVGPNNSIKWANRRGGIIVTLISNVGSTVGDLVVDTVNERIIWTQPDDSIIRSADLDGSNISDHVVGVSFPQGLIIDQSGGKLYWAGASSIESSDLDGSNVTEILFDAEEFGFFQNLTLADDTIYFSDVTNNRIASVKTDGTNYTTLFRNQTKVSGIDFHPEEEALYFSGSTDGIGFKTADPTEDSSTTLADAHGHDVIANYFVDADETPEPLITPTPTPTSTPTPTPTPTPSPTPSFTRMYMTLSGSEGKRSKIIWTSIYREVNDTAFGVTSPQAIGYSRQENNLYWVDRTSQNTSQLHRGNPDSILGTSTRLFSGPYHYESIFVDDEHNKVFLGQANDDLGVYLKDNGKVYRLHRDSGVVSRGFGFYEDDIFWTMGREIFKIDASYNPRKTLPLKNPGHFYTSSPAAVTTTDFGPYALYRARDRDYLLNRANPDISPEICCESR
jgi:hypothetical protein